MYVIAVIYPRVTVHCTLAAAWQQVGEDSRPVHPRFHHNNTQRPLELGQQWSVAWPPRPGAGGAVPVDHHGPLYASTRNPKPSLIYLNQSWSAIQKYLWTDFFFLNTQNPHCASKFAYRSGRHLRTALLDYYNNYNNILVSQQLTMSVLQSIDQGNC